MPKHAFGIGQVLWRSINGRGAAKYCAAKTMSVTLNPCPPQNLWVKTIIVLVQRKSSKRVQRIAEK